MLTSSCKRGKTRGRGVEEGFPKVSNELPSVSRELTRFEELRGVRALELKERSYTTSGPILETVCGTCEMCLGGRWMG